MNNNSANRLRKDVFHSGLVRGAHFAGELELPALRSSQLLPSRLIAFDKSISSCEYDQWVHFYIDDYRFERIWNNPTAYLDRIKRFQGVITPDFSLYREMPLVMQQWNTYRGRTIGYWLQSNNVEVIPNIRWGDERTYSFCFDGIERGKTVAVGTHGCIRKKEDRAFFRKGLAEMMAQLAPKHIIVYGRAPHDLFSPCIANGATITQFDSLFHESRHKEVV